MDSEKFQSIQDFLLVYSYSVLSLSCDRQEQVRGIEPPSSAWKADILAIVRHLHVGLPIFGRPGKPRMFIHPLLRFPLSRSAQDGDRTRTLSPARDFKSLASASSATRAYSIFKVRSFNLLGLSTQPARRDSNPHEAIANWLQYLLGGTMYSISITDQIFLFQGLQVFLNSLNLSTSLLYHIIFNLSSTFFNFFIFSFQSIKFKINLNRCTRLPNLYYSSISRGFLSQSTYLL